jgi:hypothetical protein
MQFFLFEAMWNVENVSSEFWMLFVFSEQIANVRVKKIDTGVTKLSTLGAHE